MSDYPMLISNKLHSFRNFIMQRYGKREETLSNKCICFPCRIAYALDLYEYRAFPICRKMPMNVVIFF